MEKDWVMVYTTDKPYYAEMIIHMLKDNEIEAVSINKKDSTYKSFGDVEIYVKTQNVIKSKQLINKFEN